MIKKVLEETPPSICPKCKRVVDDPHAWGIYYDPEYKRNVWGGDTFIVAAPLCDECAIELVRSLYE